MHLADPIGGRSADDVLHVMEVIDPNGRTVNLRIFARDLADPAAAVNKFCVLHGFAGVDTCAQDVLRNLVPELDRLQGQDAGGTVERNKGLASARAEDALFLAAEYSVLVQQHGLVCPTVLKVEPDHVVLGMSTAGRNDEFVLRLDDAQSSATVVRTQCMELGFHPPDPCISQVLPAWLHLLYSNIPALFARQEIQQIYTRTVPGVYPGYAAAVQNYDFGAAHGHPTGNACTLLHFKPRLKIADYNYLYGLQAACGLLCSHTTGTFSAGPLFESRTIERMDCAAYFSVAVIELAAPSFAHLQDRIPMEWLDAFTMDRTIPVRSWLARHRRDDGMVRAWPAEWIDELVSQAMEGTLVGSYGAPNTNDVQTALANTPSVPNG